MDIRRTLHIDKAMARINFKEVHTGFIVETSTSNRSKFSKALKLPLPSLWQSLLAINRTGVDFRRQDQRT
jgi:hypothetical protein